MMELVLAWTQTRSRSTTRRENHSHLEKNQNRKWQKILLIQSSGYIMLRKTLFSLLLLCTFYIGSAQELQVRLTVLSNKISTQVDKKIFQTLQTNLTNFMNNRKWTNEVYQPN